MAILMWDRKSQVERVNAEKGRAESCRENVFRSSLGSMDLAAAEVRWVLFWDFLLCEPPYAFSSFDLDLFDLVFFHSHPKDS